MGFTLQLSWKSQAHAVSLAGDDGTLEELGHAIAHITGAAYTTIKLLVPGIKGHVAPAARPGVLLSQSGIASGSRALMLASAAEEVARVQAQHDLPGMLGFEEELKRAARRRRTGPSKAEVQPPRGEFTFQAYEAWQRPGLQPAPSEALKLLYRLANDPGIVGVMASHRYRVGQLSEMPPEGKVGVSPVCVLGVNINAGQEISLRLRTDDLKGFRKYERIRETLIHELAHMEYGEHDNNFKELNSRLGKEVEQILSRHRGGHALWSNPFGEHAEEPTRRSELDNILLEDDVMASTARLSGRTLRQLAGRGTPSATAGTSSSAGVAAPAIPVPEVGAPRTAPLLGASVAGETNGDAAGSSPMPDSHAGGSGEASSDDSSGRGYEHYDPATERAEAAMRQLGSLDLDQAPAPAAHEAHAKLESATAAPANVHEAAEAKAEPMDVDQQQQQEQAGVVPPLEGAASGSVVSAAASATTGLRGQQEHGAGNAASEAQGHAAPGRGSAMPLTSGPPPPPLTAVRVELDPLPDASAEAGAYAAGDVATQKHAAAWAALRQLVAGAPDAAAAGTALSTLSTLLSNAARSPGDERYKSVRLGNGAFQRRVGYLPGGVDVLKVAGFAEEQASGAVQAAGSGLQQLPSQQQQVDMRVLRLRRNDPGLLWLVLSAVEGAVVQLQAKIAAAAASASGSVGPAESHVHAGVDVGVGMVQGM